MSVEGRQAAGSALLCSLVGSEVIGKNPAYLYIPDTIILKLWWCFNNLHLHIGFRKQVFGTGWVVWGGSCDGQTCQEGEIRILC